MILRTWWKHSLLTKKSFSYQRTENHNSHSWYILDTKCYVDFEQFWWPFMKNKLFLFFHLSFPHHCTLLLNEEGYISFIDFSQITWFYSLKYLHNPYCYKTSLLIFQPMSKTQSSCSRVLEQCKCCKSHKNGWVGYIK